MSKEKFSFDIRSILHNAFYMRRWYKYESNRYIYYDNGYGRWNEW